MYFDSVAKISVFVLSLYFQLLLELPCYGDAQGCSFKAVLRRQYKGTLGIWESFLKWDAQCDD